MQNRTAPTGAESKMMKHNIKQPDLKKVAALFLEGVKNKPETRNFTDAVVITRKGENGMEHGFYMEYNNPINAIHKIEFWVKIDQSPTEPESGYWLTTTIDYHDTTGDADGVENIYDLGLRDVETWESDFHKGYELRNALRAIERAVEAQLDNVHEGVILDQLQRGEIEPRDMPARVLMGRAVKWEWVNVEFRNPDTGAVIGTELMRRRAGGCQGMGDLDHLVRSLSNDKCKKYEGCEVYEPRASE